MSERKITLTFDTTNAMHERIYYALMNLPGFYAEADISEAVIRFVNDLIVSIGECEERESRCQQLLESLLGKQAAGRVQWQ
jgi:hypothetical protein